MSRPVPFLIVLTALVLLASSLHAQQRTWQDASGSFTVDAELIDMSDSTVTLRRSDNSVVEVPISKLCDADRLYIQEILNPAKSPLTGNNDLNAPAEASPEPVQYDNSLDAFWGGYTNAMQQLTDKGPIPAKAVDRLKWVSSLAPESIKEPRLPMIMFLSGVILAPFAYIWLLIHEFRASLLWGIAQLTADLVGACFFPLLGGIVFVIFAATNFSDSWKPILMNFLVLILVVGTFVMIPGEVYSNVKPPAPEPVWTEQPQAAPATPVQPAP